MKINPLNQLPHQHQGKSVRELIHALEPNDVFILMHPEHQERLVCQLARHASGLPYYVAGPRFNGDAIITLATLMEAKEIDAYNELHTDAREHVYSCGSAEDACNTIAGLFAANTLR